MSYCGLYIEHKIYYESVDVGGCEHSRPLLDQNFENFISRTLRAPHLMPENISLPPPPLNIFIINVLSLIL
jgi:hypothetical protein